VATFVQTVIEVVH